MSTWSVPTMLQKELRFVIRDARKLFLEVPSNKSERREKFVYVGWLTLCLTVILVFGVLRTR